MNRSIGIQSRLRVIELWLGIAGVVFLFLDLIGFFQPRNRIHLYRELMRTQVVPVQLPAAHEVLEHFAFPDQLLDQVEHIKLVRVGIGTQGPPIAGELQGLSRDGKKKAFASLDEFRDWAYASPKIYRWLSFVLLVGVLVCKGIRAFLSSELEKSKRPCDVLAA